MLDFRVKTFLTLYEEMNYRRTAQRLNMTQPGVTQHIHYLEDYYATKLFVYDGKTLKKTKSAEELKRYIDSVLVEEKNIRSGFVPSEEKNLKVGATKTIGEYVLVPAIEKFLSVPNNNLELIIDNTKNLLQMLERTELDFAVIEGVFDKAKYGYHLFKKENFIGICSDKHKFAEKKYP